MGMLRSYRGPVSAAISPSNMTANYHCSDHEMGAAMRELRAVAVIAIGAVTPGAGQTYTCLPGSDSRAIGLRDYVVELVTATDSAAVVDRVWYKLPVATAKEVSVQTGKSICAIAGASYSAAVRPGETPLSTTLVVVKVSTTRYVVRDMIYASGGEFTATVIFDNRWKRLAGWDS
jgi:hypothetical protein